jgi:hypothetical protein
MGYYMAGGFFSFVSHAISAVSKAVTPIWSSTLKPLVGAGIKAASTVYPAVGAVSAGLARGEALVRGVGHPGGMPDPGLPPPGGVGPATGATAHAGVRGRRRRPRVVRHRRARRH